MRDFPWTMLPNPQAPTGLVCITSPGVTFDLRQEVNATEGKGWIDIMKYADPSRLLRSVVAQYQGVTFIETPLAILWNAGTWTAQSAIKAAASAYDGAPNPTTTKVDGTYRMGESGIVGQKHYIQLATGQAANFAKGDIVTIHKLRTNAYGVTNGVDYEDPDLVAGWHESRIVEAPDTVNDRITINRPLGIDYTTDLGGTVFGYVTKGQHIHTSVFLGSNQGIKRGVVTPPKVMFPRAVDDFLSQERITWKGMYGENLWQPEVFEVVLSSGSIRGYGDRIAG
jgi:hypothetical protein